MTAQQINHIARLALVRAQASRHTATAEQWDAIVALKRLACRLAASEIAANGYTHI